MTGVVPAGTAPVLFENGARAQLVEPREPRLGARRWCSRSTTRSRCAGRPLAGPARRPANCSRASTRPTRSVWCFRPRGAGLTRALSPATFDVAAALRALATDARAGTALYDAVVAAAHALSSSCRPVRVLVLLTDGRDVGCTASLQAAVAAAQPRRDRLLDHDRPRDCEPRRAAPPRGPDGGQCSMPARPPARSEPFTGASRASSTAPGTLVHHRAPGPATGSPSPPGRHGSRPARPPPSGCPARAPRSQAEGSRTSSPPRLGALVVSAAAGLRPVRDRCCCSRRPGRRSSSAARAAHRAATAGKASATPTRPTFQALLTAPTAAAGPAAMDRLSRLVERAGLSIPPRWSS